MGRHKKSMPVAQEQDILVQEDACIVFPDGVAIHGCMILKRPTGLYYGLVEGRWYAIEDPRLGADIAGTGVFSHWKSLTKREYGKAL